MLYEKLEAFVVCHLAECSFDVLGEIVEHDPADLDFHHSGLDLGEIENLVDQLQQIGARRMDRPRKFPLLVAESVFGIGKELRENEHAVQRRAKFV